MAIDFTASCHCVAKGTLARPDAPQLGYIRDESSWELLTMGSCIVVNALQLGNIIRDEGSRELLTMIGGRLKRLGLIGHAGTHIHSAGSGLELARDGIDL